MVTRFKPLDNPILDPRTDQDLLSRSIDRAFTASRGKLNSFSAGDPLRALIEAQIISVAENLYRLNLLPEAYAVEFFKINGIMQKLGSAARVTLTFTLQQSLSTPFFIPAGFVCQTSNKIEFTTDASLTIPPGYVSGDVSATCSQLGLTGNVSAFTINQFTVPLTFLKAVTNQAAAAGGTDGETLDQTKARAFASLRRRGLVSQDDYEQEAISFLGDGAVAHTIGNLGADKIEYVKGTAHTFVLNPDSTQLNEAELSALLAQLSGKAHIGVDTYVSNIDLFPVDVRVIANLQPGTNPQLVADTIYSRLSTYLKPGVLPLGKSILIKELEFQSRLAGVASIQTVLLGPHLSALLSTNLALPYIYSAAQLTGLVVELVQDNATFEFSYGDGDLD